MKRGRPRLSDRRRHKSVSIDGDLLDMLNSIANGLVDKFGFRPSISQTVRYLLSTSKFTPARGAARHRRAETATKTSGKVSSFGK